MPTASQSAVHSLFFHFFSADRARKLFFKPRLDTLSVVDVALIAFKLSHIVLISELRLANDTRILLFLHPLASNIVEVSHGEGLHGAICPLFSLYSDLISLILVVM